MVKELQLLGIVNQLSRKSNFYSRLLGSTGIFALPVFSLILILMISVVSPAKNDCAGSLEAGPHDFSGEVKRRLKLFKNDAFSGDYDKLIDKIEVGDFIEMPSGRVYQVQEILDTEKGTRKGSLSRIIDVGNGWAVRLPRRSKQVDSRYLEAVQGFYDLQPELLNAGIPVVEVNRSLSELPFAVMVRREKLSFTLSEFFAERPPKSVRQLSDSEREQIEREFKRWMETTWAYISIDDVRSDQLAWNGTKWILFDFFGFGSDPHWPLRRFSETRVVMSKMKFEDPSFGSWTRAQIPENLEKGLRKKISRIRKEKSKSAKWFERTSERSSDTSEIVDRVTKRPLPRGFKRAFSKKTTWMERDFTASGPIPKTIKIKIHDFLKEAGDYEVYSARMNDNREIYLYVLIDQNKKSFERHFDWIKELKNNGTEFISGSDFVALDR